ncbi:MAG TPA: hypothetical protein VGC41_09115, partial [Kofleriaceae bacterium]
SSGPPVGEDSFDLVVETGNGYHHPTPTGFERVDAEPMKAHELRRAALELVLAPGDPTKDDKYLAALRLLGADAKLIAECKKL